MCVYLQANGLPVISLSLQPNERKTKARQEGTEIMSFISSPFYQSCLFCSIVRSILSCSLQNLILLALQHTLILKEQDCECYSKCIEQNCFSPLSVITFCQSINTNIARWPPLLHFVCWENNWSSLALHISNSAYKILNLTQFFSQTLVKIIEATFEKNFFLSFTFIYERKNTWTSCSF